MICKTFVLFQNLIFIGYCFQFIGRLLNLDYRLRTNAWEASGILYFMYHLISHAFKNTSSMFNQMKVISIIQYYTVWTFYRYNYRVLKCDDKYTFSMKLNDFGDIFIMLFVSKYFSLMTFVFMFISINLIPTFTYHIGMITKRNRFINVNYISNIFTYVCFLNAFCIRILLHKNSVLLSHNTIFSYFLYLLYVLKLFAWKSMHYQYHELPM